MGLGVVSYYISDVIGNRIDVCYEFDLVFTGACAQGECKHV
jgi:hypothetical protein